MQANVGRVDKVIRIIGGIALLAFAYYGQGTSRWLGLIGIVPILTAVTSFCPLYALLGVKTCEVSERR